MSEEDKKNLQRRRQYFIDKEFQQRFIWHFVLIVITSIFFSQIIILGYIKLKELISPSSQSLIYFANTLTETLAFSRVLEVVWLPLIFSSLLGSALVLIFALFYSHRMAGPLFNLKRMMRQVEEGNLRVTMRIRKNDEFHDVEHAFNQMVKGLNTFLQQLNQAISNLPNSSKKKFEDILKELRIEGVGE